MARGVSSTSHANTPNPLVFLICPSPWQQRALVAHEDPGAKPVTYGEIVIHLTSAQLYLYSQMPSYKAHGTSQILY